MPTRIILLILAMMTLAGCTATGERSTVSFGQAPQSAPAAPNVASGAPSGSQLAERAAAPLVPAGFRAVPEAVGIERPGGLAVDDLGGVYLIEGGNRLIRLGADGGRNLVAQGAEGTTWTGVASTGGVNFVTAVEAGGAGQLLRIGADGRSWVVIDGLPVGDHPVEAPAIGPDGMVYVATGTVTDAGVVDANAKWRTATPRLHDVPCQDIRLSGRDFASGGRQTGAFVPYGTATQPGQAIPGQVPCSGAVLRTGQNGGPVQLVAWGFRDPRSLAFTPDGRLYLLDGNFAGGGPRPVGAGGDLIYAVAAGVWYGWPDVHGGGPAPQPVLAAQPNPPPHPLAEFSRGTHAISLDIARAELFGGPVQAYVALDTPQRGSRVVRLDLRTGAIEGFADFPQGSVPVALRFSHTGEALYVLDQGGTLWRVERDIPVG